jgi:hypothetical protein
LKRSKRSRRIPRTGGRKFSARTGTPSVPIAAPGENVS